MGFDSTVHTPVNKSRSMLNPYLLDYEPYDWRGAAEKQRRRKGFVMDKVGRRGGRFYGSSWRGCASLVPTNVPDGPTSYINRDKGERGRNVVRAAMESKAPARGTLDSLRMGLNNVPKAKGAVGRKLGPGFYDDVESKERIERKGNIAGDRGKESSAFRAPGREDRLGDKFDVFAKANRAVEERERREKEERKDRENQEGNPYAMYRNVRPTESLRFLRQVQKDDGFHEMLKRIEEGKQTEEEKRYLEKIRYETIRRAESVNGIISYDPKF